MHGSMIMDDLPQPFPAVLITQTDDILAVLERRGVRARMRHPTVGPLIVGFCTCCGFPQWREEISDASLCVFWACDLASVRLPETAHELMLSARIASEHGAELPHALPLPIELRPRRAP